MAATYYLPATVIPDDRCLAARHLWRTHRMRLSDIRHVVALPLPSLVNEVGFILADAAGNSMWIRETDLHFHWLAGELDADRLLGADWYARVDAGERLTADVRAD